MSELYNYEYYHCCCGPIAYEEPAHWVEFFGGIADRIVNDLKPKTVLDAGCAMGYLVAALRDRGVDAYGIDISEYAISKVREDIKPYCVVGSLTEPLPDCLPRKYDLVVTIEVLEHLYEEDGKRAIHNLCTFSDRIIFSSTPDDFSEHTHFNVQQREYWAKLFAAEGFYDDLSYRPTYLTAYASSFRKSADWVRQVEDYERNIRMAEAERAHSEAGWRKAVDDKETHIQNLTAMLDTSEKQWAAQAEQNRIEREENTKKLAEQEQLLEQYQVRRTADAQRFVEQEEQIEQYQIERETTAQRLAEQEQQLEEYQVQQESGERLLAELRQQCDEVGKELAHYQEHYHAAIAQREELKQQLAQAQYAYNVISDAFFWKITKPFRVVLDGIKSILRRNHFTHLVCKGLKCWKENGFSYTWKKVQDRRHHRQDFARAARPLFTPEELEVQKKDTFPREVKFSILVPLYNTPEEFLREMIRSVLDQTYSNWELCLADGSDGQHREVERICKSYMRKDSRVQYKKLEKNEGISENTNACIEMATGNYIALLDHDDLLHPAALHEVMKAICEQDADFIYTDEATFESPNVNKIITAHFKPDFAPDNLKANNYICHFSVFAKTVLDKAGYFRKAYDGSQDHDMVLRLTEKAKKIVHIPHILYYWRSHPQSVSMDVSSKMYAVQAGKDAVKDSILRSGDEAEVESSRAHPTIYRLKYQLKGMPKVSIIIPNRNHTVDIKLCIDSILSHTTYQNYEIVIVDNGSNEPELLNYYDSLKNYPQLHICSLDIEFNYSKLNNFGVQHATGEYYILLNNDTEIITPEWIEEMLMFCQRKDVGAVGAMLYYPDNTIQHAGIILGLGADRVAGHAFHRWGRDAIGYMGRLCYAQNMSAVTAACMMVKAAAYQQLGGLDESFEVAYNDVDFCMRLRKAGYLIVWTPYAELYHYESKSRGYEDTPEKRKRFEGEVKRFQARWSKELAAGDPYYNPNLTLNREDFSLK